MPGGDACKTVENLGAMGYQDKKLLNKKQKVWFCKRKSEEKKEALYMHVANDIARAGEIWGEKGNIFVALKICLL